MHRLSRASLNASVAEVVMSALEPGLTLKSHFLGLLVSGHENTVRENCSELPQNSDTKLAIEERWLGSLLS